jgi:hypothetical protein
MARRPPGADREVWRAERDQIWKRRNMILNLLMVIAILAVLWRNCS